MVCRSARSNISWNRWARGPGVVAVWRIGRGGDAVTAGSCVPSVDEEEGGCWVVVVVVLVLTLSDDGPLASSGWG